MWLSALDFTFLISEIKCIKSNHEPPTIVNLYSMIGIKKFNLSFLIVLYLYSLPQEDAYGVRQKLVFFARAVCVLSWYVV